MKKTADKPPILSFLLLFSGLLIVALGLAALAPAADVSNATAEPAGGHRDDAKPELHPSP